MTEILLYLAPLLLLVYALALGRHPGEKQIARLRCAVGRPAGRTSPQPCTAASRSRGALLLPRGGRLVAAAVAARPPPAG